VRSGVEGRFVPIALSQRGAVFQPDDIRAIAAVFEDCLRTLGLKSGNDPGALSLASKIMELAKDGERNQARLREATLKWIRRTPP
jgi:hypothetical protein